MSFVYRWFSLLFFVIWGVAGFSQTPTPPSVAAPGWNIVLARATANVNQSLLAGGGNNVFSNNTTISGSHLSGSPLGDMIDGADSDKTPNRSRVVHAGTGSADMANRANRKEWYQLVFGVYDDCSLTGTAYDHRHRQGVVTGRWGNDNVLKLKIVFHDSQGTLVLSGTNQLKMSHPFGDMKKIGATGPITLTKKQGKLKPAPVTYLFDAM